MWHALLLLSFAVFGLLLLVLIALILSQKPDEEHGARVKTWRLVVLLLVLVMMHFCVVTVMKMF